MTFATDENGYIGMPVLLNNSLKIHHVSFDPIIVKPNAKNTPQPFVLIFEENILEIIVVKYQDIEMTH